MSKSWVLNQVFGPLPESWLDEIPRPRTELGCHVTLKTSIMGAMLGTVAAGPAVAWAKGERSQEGVLKWSEKCGTTGAIIGAFIGAPLAAYVLDRAQANEDSIRDRCYRIRFNRKQIRVDRWAAIGAAAGYGAAIYLGEVQKTNIATLLGLSAGTLFAGIILNPLLGYGSF